MATPRKILVKKHTPVESRRVLDVLKHAHAAGLKLTVRDLHTALSVPFGLEDRARMRATLARLFSLGCAQHQGAVEGEHGRPVPVVQYIKDLPPPRVRKAPAAKAKSAKPKAYPKAQDDTHSNHYTDGLPMVASVFGLADYVGGRAQSLRLPVSSLPTSVWGSAS